MRSVIPCQSVETIWTQQGDTGAALSESVCCFFHIALGFRRQAVMTLALPSLREKLAQWASRAHQARLDRWAPGSARSESRVARYVVGARGPETTARRRSTWQILWGRRGNALRRSSMLGHGCCMSRLTVGHPAGLDQKARSRLSKHRQRERSV